MFIFDRRNENDGTVNEAKTNEKALKPSGIVVDVLQIFALLHAKAKVEADKIGSSAKPNPFVVENTAAEGNDNKTAVFHSAGEHMILAKTTDPENFISKQAAFEGIKKYVETFLGPDISKGLSIEDCIPMLDVDVTEAPVSESVAFTVSFNEFLTESSFERKRRWLEEEEGGEDGDEDEEGEDAEEDEEGEDGDEDEEGEDAEEDEEGEDAEEDEEGEDAEEDKDKEKGDGEDPEDAQEAKGYYMLYGLKIAGLKETTVKDAFKKWGADLIKNMGVQFRSWGSAGDLHTIGGGIKNVKAMIGHILEPDKIVSGVKNKLEKRFPKVTVSTVEFRDQKTLLADLDKTPREGWDGKTRQKVKSAKYSLYIEIENDDPKKPFVNRKDLANIVTMSIPNLTGKLKNLVKADSIIFLRGDSAEKGKRYGTSSGGEIPSFIRLKKRINKAKDLDDKVLELEAVFKGVKKYKNTEATKEIVDIFNEYDEKWNKSRISEDSIDEFLRKYKEWYIKFKKNQETSTNENLDTVQRDIISLLLERMSGFSIRDVLEAENEEENKKEEEEKKEGDGEKKPEGKEEEKSGEKSSGEGASGSGESGSGESGSGLGGSGSGSGSGSSGSGSSGSGSSGFGSSGSGSGSGSSGSSSGEAGSGSGSNGSGSGEAVSGSVEKGSGETGSGSGDDDSEEGLGFDSDDDSNGSSGNDLYIIPMPGVDFEDDDTSSND